MKLVIGVLVGLLLGQVIALPEKPALPLAGKAFEKQMLADLIREYEILREKTVLIQERSKRESFTAFSANSVKEIDETLNTLRNWQSEWFE